MMQILQVKCQFSIYYDVYIEKYEGVQKKQPFL